MDLFTTLEKPRRGTRLPVDWSPSPEARQFAIGLGLDPVAVGDAFRDFWIAKPGAGGVKLDWLATWRTWCRTTKERQPKPFKSRFEEKTVSVPSETEWAPRLRGYMPGKWWSPMWGPRPESGKCWAPASEVVAWKQLAGLSNEA